MLVIYYLRWVKKKFGNTFKMSNFYANALEDVEPIKLVHEFASYFLQYLECDKMNGVIFAISSAFRQFSLYNTRLDTLVHAKERRELLDRHLKITRAAIIESLAPNDEKEKDKLMTFLRRI